MRGRFDAANEYEAMLSAIAHDLSLPLLQIKARTELAKFDKNTKAELSILSESGLRLIDSYLTALDARASNLQLTLEPITIGSVLTDTAAELSQFAKQYQTELVVEVAGRSKPILSNKAKLQAALYCLASSLIKAQAGSTAGKNVIVLAAHRNTSESMTAGVFGNFTGLNDKDLYNARRLAGRAGQPLSALPAQNGGGILIADMLMGALYQPLKAARFKELSGFAAQLPLSKQLKLV